MPAASPPDWILDRRRVIGQRIREARRRAKLTQEAVANLIGTDRSSIVEIEQGQRNVTVNMLIRIADAIGVPLADFFK